MGVDNHGCRERDRRGRSSVSRRKFLSGSLLAVGGCSQFVTSQTVGAFQDSDDAAGGVQVASLNVAVHDQSGIENGVRYLLSYQVQMSKGYDGIEVTVNNTSNSEDPVPHTRSASDGKEGVIKHDVEGFPIFSTFEFTFEVLAAGEDVSNPVLTETVTDRPGGGSPPGDDMGGEDAPSIQQITVTDESDENGQAQYEVSYQVGNTEGFDGEVRVHFENDSFIYSLFTPEGNQTISSSSVTSGTVSYPNDGGSYSAIGTFDITVEVVKSNGIVIDSVTIPDNPGGDGKSWPE